MQTFDTNHFINIIERLRNDLSSIYAGDIELVSEETLSELNKTTCLVCGLAVDYESSCEKCGTYKPGEDE